MIEISNTEVYGFEAAVRGMRNPLQSYDKSDSYRDDKGNFVLGPNDLDLAKRLTKAGESHRKCLRQIFVSADILAPLFWHKQMDQYKIGTTTNSTSTMHTIHKKEFLAEDFSHENLSGEYLESLNLTIRILNLARRRYLETKDREHWDAMIQLLPSSYNQLRTWTGNYEVLLNIYHQRKHHKLGEWNTFCSWIETLPYFKEICLE